MLTSFSLTDFFAFEEQIKVATSSGVVGVKKRCLVVTSLLLVKCSVTEGISSDKFFSYVRKIMVKLITNYLLIVQKSLIPCL